MIMDQIACRRTIWKAGWGGVIMLAIMMICVFHNPAVIFHDDFSVQGQHDWEMGDYWDYMEADSMREYFYETTGVGGQILICDSLISPGIEIPSYTDSLVLSVPAYFHAYAATLGMGLMHARAEITIQRAGQSEGIWEFYTSSGSWFSVTWSDTLVLEVPQSIWSPGDVINLCFAGEGMVWPAYYDGIIEVDWRLDEVTLTAHIGQYLEGSTWGSIKCTF